MEWIYQRFGSMPQRPMTVEHETIENWVRLTDDEVIDGNFAYLEKADRFLKAWPYKVGPDLFSSFNNIGIIDGKHLWVPGPLLEHAGINGRCACVYVIDHYELWNPESLREDIMLHSDSGFNAPI